MKKGASDNYPAGTVEVEELANDRALVKDMLELRTIIYLYPGEHTVASMKNSCNDGIHDTVLGAYSFKGPVI